MTETKDPLRERVAISQRRSRRIAMAAISLVVLVPLYAFLWSDLILFRIEIGMSKQMVHQLAGDPLSTWYSPTYLEIWDYTRPWSRHARVAFDSSGLVAAVETD